MVYTVNEVSIPFTGNSDCAAFYDVSSFLGRATGEEPEYEVAKDPRSRYAKKLPGETLMVSVEKLEDGPPLRGRVTFARSQTGSYPQRRSRWARLASRHGRANSRTWGADQETLRGSRYRTSLSSQKEEKVKLTPIACFASVVVTEDGFASLTDSPEGKLLVVSPVSQRCLSGRSSRAVALSIDQMVLEPRQPME
jgi:hypothetical protein